MNSWCENAKLPSHTRDESLIDTPAVPPGFPLRAGISIEYGREAAYTRLLVTRDGHGALNLARGIKTSS